MRMKTLLAVVVAASFFLVGFQAQALMLDPDDADWVGPLGSVPHNPDVNDMETIVGVSPLELYYKDNVGGGEEGSFAAFYETSYFTDANDPEGATIEFGGDPGDEITCPECFLLVKGGRAHDPIWYAFDIGGWNGTDDIVLEDFWPAQGAISHVQIAGMETPSVPEPTMLLLFATCLIGLAGMRSIRKL